MAFKITKVTDELFHVNSDIEVKYNFLITVCKVLELFGVIDVVRKENATVTEIYPI